MEAINVHSITRSPAYIEAEPARIFEKRTIHRFVLKNPNDQEVIESAATAITSLLRNNPQLCFVSRPSKNKTLQDKIRSCPYLVINGDALCLSKEPKGPIDLDVVFKDIRFSEAVIQKPVQCSRNRTFEKKYLKVWLELKGNICPCLNHSIDVDSVQIDDYILARIHSTLKMNQDRLNQLEKLTQKIRQLEEKGSIASKNNQELRKRIRQIEKKELIASENNQELRKKVADLEKPSRKIELIGGACKSVEKIIIYPALKVADFTVGSAAHTFLKSVPFVSLAFGGILAIYRYKDGQYIRAVGEVASGVANVFPGVGTIIGLTLDGLMIICDIHETKYGIKVNKTEINKIEKINIKKAHEILALDPKETHTKEAIQKAFKQRCTLRHSDTVGCHLKNHKQQLDQFQSAMYKSKDVLYDHYGYTD